jgi:hypothetical protein
MIIELVLKFYTLFLIRTIYKELKLQIRDLFTPLKKHYELDNHPYKA